ncbi:MAG TPA: hypothetical protein VE842_09815 [Pyrinomonadaceae bacterium]|nr:hypothetical protein [Pyrinomonadaceae bacterium]
MKNTASVARAYQERGYFETPSMNIFRRRGWDGGLRRPGKGIDRLG